MGRRNSLIPQAWIVKSEVNGVEYKFAIYAVNARFARWNGHDALVRLFGYGVATVLWVRPLRKGEEFPASLELQALRKLKVGDILTYSWGYDQTNVDAYEVVRESKASVWLRPVGLLSVEATGGMSDRVQPEVGAYLSEELLVKRRKAWGGEEHVVFDHGVGSLWKGRDLHRSWYH